MKNFLLILIAYLFSFSAYSLELDKPKETENIEIQKTTDDKYSSYPEHYGNSHFSFNKLGIPSDTFIVVDRGVDNDSYQFRNTTDEPELTFYLNIHRYVGQIEKLKANGLISSKAKLYIPAYDIDNASGQRDCDFDGIDDQIYPEVDEVYFNGELIGTLKGANNKWDLDRNIFEIDIDKLNLLTEPNEGGFAPNTVEIKIDVLNKDTVMSGGTIGCRAWATEIDYVALEFEVVDPVVFVVGLFGEPTIFTDSEFFTRVNDELGIPSILVDHTRSASSSSCSGSGIESTSFYEHGNNLYDKVLEAAGKFGAHKFNLIVHSKAGSDSKWFMERVKKEKTTTVVGNMGVIGVLNPIEVNTFVTLDTPFKGSAAADFGVMLDDYFLGENIQSWYLQDICDLRTTVNSEFNAEYQTPKDVLMYVLGANADNSGDGTVTDDSREWEAFPGGKFAANTLHKIVRKYKSITAIPDNYSKYIIFRIYNPEFNDTPAENDIVVTLESSTPMEAEYYTHTIGNHSTIAFSKENTEGEPIYSGGQDIVIDRALNGFLKWRVEQ